MKLAFFTTKEQYIRYLNERVESSGKGLAREKKFLQDELKGIGKKSFCAMNKIPAELQDAEWAHHIEWRAKNVKYYERQIKKWEREIRKAEAMEV